MNSEIEKPIWQRARIIKHPDYVQDDPSIGKLVWLIGHRLHIDGGWFTEEHSGRSYQEPDGCFISNVTSSDGTELLVFQAPIVEFIAERESDFAFDVELETADEYDERCMSEEFERIKSEQVKCLKSQVQ